MSGANSKPRTQKGRTISLDYLEALSTKKAVEAYITTLEGQDDNAAALVSKEDAINTLEGVVDKLDALPYFNRSVATTKGKTKPATQAAAASAT